MTTDLVKVVSADGSFDASDTLADQVEALRLQGNEAFKRREFQTAKEIYSHAISLQNTNHLLFGNRSAACYQLKEFHEALEDANKAIELSPDWSKGYLRKGVACESLQRWNEAVDAYDHVLRLEKGTVSPEAKTAMTRGNALKRRNLAVKKGFLSGKHSSAIYSEKDDLGQDTMQRSWKSMLRKLLDGCNKRGVNSRGENVVLDDGVFAKLLQEDEFQRLIYPGIPTEQLVHAPKNLQALLEDPWYDQELLALMPKVEAKAASVLSNVKKRGAEQGDVMDPTTERMLMPQVMQEAFGREVLAMVHRVNYQKHVKLTNDTRLLADPNSDFATWDQLNDEFLDELLIGDSAVRGVAVLNEFMGKEWTQLLLNDVSRMSRNGLLMTTVSSEHVLRQQEPKETLPGVKLRFVEHQDCVTEYPAIAELVEKLHALPYEINKKRPDKAKLCAQFVHSTAVHQLPARCHQPLRLDCGVGDKDNGFKLTCVYFFNAVDLEQRRTSLQLRTAIHENAPVRKIYPESDRLVVYQSQSVFNEITAVPDGEDLFYLMFWVHGQALE